MHVILHCFVVYALLFIPLFSLPFISLFNQKKGEFCIKITGVGRMHMKGVLLLLHLPIKAWQEKLTSPEGLQQYN